MIDGSEKHNHQLAFELQNLHVCEKRSSVTFIHFLKLCGACYLVLSQLRSQVLSLTPLSLHKDG